VRSVHAIAASAKPATQAAPALAVPRVKRVSVAGVVTMPTSAARPVWLLLAMPANVNNATQPAAPVWAVPLAKPALMDCAVTTVGRAVVRAPTVAQTCVAMTKTDKTVFAVLPVRSASATAPARSHVRPVADFRPAHALAAAPSAVT